jgi:CDP-6-deoxy-D-xylo-4-hexulose-3-dehydrase
MKIKLIKSSFYQEAASKRALVTFITNTKQLSIGPQCAQFEIAFARWQERKYSVMFNSGSSANLALIQALMNLGRIQKGDKVAFSGITWSTNVTPLIQLDLRPVAVDVDLHTLNISPKTLMAAYKIEPFSCLFITNLLGYSDDLKSIRTFCKKNKILLIEDNCESLGSEFKGIKLGNFGVASTFSFFVGHHMSTIEGGAVCTDDPVLDMMLRIVRSHGWDRHLIEEQRLQLHTAFNIKSFYSKYTFYDLGYNLRPTEIQGFLGIGQLKYLNTIVKKRAKNYAILEKIYMNPDFLPIKNKMTLLSNFAFPFIARTPELKEYYMQKAEREQIEIRPIVGGDMTAQPFYQKYVPRLTELPVSRKIHDLGFYCGNNPEMTRAELTHLVKVFSKR